MSATARTWFLILAILLGACTACAETTTLNDSLQTQAVIQQPILDDAPYRNAMYLYLRLAGVVWIAVEWTAAFLLWRAYRLLTSLTPSERPAP